MLDSLRAQCSAAWTFAQERCPVWASAGISLALVTAQREWRLDALGVRALVCASLLLFCARALDDLADMPVDRVRHPDRGLVRGRIAPEALWRAVGVTIVLILGLLALGGWLVPCVVLLHAAVVLGYYAARHRLPGLVGPCVVNAILPSIVLLQSLDRSGISRETLWLASFVWLGALGHDLAHSLGETPGSLNQAPLAARFQVLLSACCFTGAMATGVAGAMTFRDSWFVGALGLTCIWILVLLLRIWISPVHRNARRFYVAGFLFFLLPLLSRAVGLTVGQ